MTDLLSQEVLGISTCILTVGYFVLGLAFAVRDYRAKKDSGEGFLVMVSSPFLGALTIPVLVIGLIAACIFGALFLLVFISSKFVDLLVYLF